MSEETAPFCLCLAGPNGSGKSTVTKGIRNVHHLNSWIDPDIVAEETRAQYGKSMDEQQSSQLAFRTARNRRVEYAQNLRDFGFETVFSHISSAEFLDALKNLGYIVHLYFVCTDSPEINVGRVRNRHTLGGHAVPEDKIVDRYHRALSNLSGCIRRFDRIVLIDNSGAYGQGQAVGQIRNGSGTKVELFPRPYLPLWVLDALNPALMRSSQGPVMLYENQYYRGDAGRRKDLLDQFLV